MDTNYHGCVDRDAAAKKIQRWWRYGLFREVWCHHLTRLPFKRRKLHGISEYTCGTRREWSKGELIDTIVSCKDVDCGCHDSWEDWCEGYVECLCSGGVSEQCDWS